ncbi:MAG: GntR family transcriptional regulator [Rhodobiaceae bacterium]|nr:GntR family transcriptional regulator [Rhodobiaceae bacterium]MCC0014455.1 GntR family transcriptional regulator [Rhodobiaceae bacterium]
MKPLQQQPNLTDQVYQAILDGICSGDLAPGTHLVQEQIAERLGVSRQPVQQAMALLKSNGIVREQRGRGLAIAPLDLEAMRQRYDIRASLDELAARRAAEQAAASPKLAARIRREGNAIIEAGRAAVENGDLPDMVAHDVSFHEFIYEMCGNSLIGTTAELHWHYLRRVMAEVLRYALPGPAIWQQHEDILEAILDGDAESAGTRAREHVLNAANRLAGAFIAHRQETGRSLAS